MISWGFGNNCKQAKPYYYDAVEGADASIPSHIQLHIQNCTFCQTEINRLVQVLGDTDKNPELTYRTALLNTFLEKHFRYVEHPVFCDTVRPFLPMLASSEFNISIPTPITVHIDQCPQCKDLLNDVKSLNLSDMQLQRLTNCLERAEVHENHIHRSDSELKAMASVNYAQVDTAVLDETCQCLACQQRILEFRHSIKSQPDINTDLCHTLDWEDLFDFVYPLGSNPLSDEYTAFREVTIHHIQNCHACQQRLERLNQLIVELLNPSEKQVATRFELEQEVDLTSQDISDDYPVRVTVEQPVADVELASVLKTASPIKKVARFQTSWLKQAAIVLILIGVGGLASMISKAEAGFLDHVYDATTHMPVVHVVVREFQESPVISESWILPPYKIVEIKNETKSVFNVNTRERIVWHDSGRRTSTMLNPELLPGLESQIRGLNGLWPSVISQSAELISQEDASEDVYEMQWTDKNITYRWRATVEPETNLVRSVKRETLNSVHTSSPKLFEVDYPTLDETNTQLEMRGIFMN